jgi:outer membrane immunogenic protein
MRKLILVAAAASAFAAAPALAQDASATGTSSDSAVQTSAAPASDGPKKVFGVEPYVAVMGGWEQFDNEPSRAGIPQSPNRHDRLNGSLVQGIVGFNVPIGPLFVGAEGNATKGVSGDIDWEYGAAGRFGVRAGNNGLFYGKVGYQWVNFARFGDNSPDYHAMTYGIGFEVGPKSTGALGGVRLRGEVNTFGNAHSFRPMAGLVKSF